MADRKLRIVRASSPVFAECERCHAKFSSYNAIPAEAERQVRAAFKEHKCEDEEAKGNVAVPNWE
jgi:hypothetical protein